MSKAIMISDHAKWCALMMNGKKKVEVRKEGVGKAVQKLIDENGYAEIYVCCSKAKHIKDYLQIENGEYICDVPKDYESELNGKVLFKFYCYKVEKIEIVADDYWTESYMWSELELLEDSCLNYTELDNYLKHKIGGYAIHISDLEIFDKPKELSEFNNCDKYPYTKYIGKAPQNMVYIEIEDSTHI